MQTTDRRISIRVQTVAKKFCAAVKIVAKQSTTGCHGVDFIVRCILRNNPPSPGIARYSNITKRNIAFGDFPPDGGGRKAMTIGQISGYPDDLA